MTGIALESGFSGCSHFSSMFKNHFKMKPPEVRHEARQRQGAPVRSNSEKGRDP